MKNVDTKLATNGGLETGQKAGKSAAVQPAVPVLGVQEQADRVREGGGRGSAFAPPGGGGGSLSQDTGDFQAMGPFAFRERDVAEWLGMPQKTLQEARAKKPAGVALIGNFVMYDPGYLEAMLLGFGLAEKTAQGLLLTEGLTWGPLLEKTRAWANQSAAPAEKTVVVLTAKVVRHLINPFLFLVEVTSEGKEQGKRVSVAVKRREERAKFKPGLVVEISPIAGRPVWGVVKGRPDVETVKPQVGRTDRPIEPQKTQTKQKGEQGV